MLKTLSKLLPAFLTLGAAGCGSGAQDVPAELAAERAEAVSAAIAAQRERFDAAPDPFGEAAYQFVFEGLSLPVLPLSAFEGEVIMVVNTASRCGLTPQYEGLQALHETYQGEGFSVVGVPSGDFLGQELATSEEIAEFCALNFGVTFPMAARHHVRGSQAHPFYQWARESVGEDAVPQWNFHKLLIGRDGRILATFGSRVDPQHEDIIAAIEAALRG